MKSFFSKSCKLVAFFILGSVLVFSQQASAVDSKTSAVNAVRVFGSGNISISLKGDNNGCGGNAFWVSDADMKQTAMSIALTAITSGKKIKARNVTCTNSPWPNTATASDITLFD
ncbi:hypothetical protein [Aliiglaciecola sp. M165]|uniref:hypothetical protein n=1 Tax=Aliiglaciecola sp. M165 TaxID=2593649 RepID=UPI00117D8804|nr:hypothetical protein [Aliiglaciecola sp. M165]TRY33413.1 hypothetical protein FM019_05410 [Aliiglaciecola sp. M165]